MSEPAVLHAVIALSAAHPCNFDPDQTSDARDRFTVKQYSKAICALQPLLRYGDRASVMVVLVTCQVFTFLEFIRGRYRSAETHLRNGVRLLRDMSCNDGGKVTSALDKGIVKSFKALITQTSLFGIAFDDTELFLYPLQASGVSSGEAFSSSEEAKDALDAILRHIMLLSQRAEKDNATSSKQQYDERCSAQKHISAVLESWHNNYLRIMTPKFNKDAPTCPESALASSLPFGTHIPQSASPTYTRTHLSYHLLLMYHTMARLLNLSLSPDFCQTRYKAYTGLFLAILTHAHTIFTAYRLAQSIPGNVNLDDSVSESGFIAPLYYTGIKCRVGRVRRFAQRLLRVVPHKEGMWDAFVAANVVGRVMQLEEPSVCSKGEDEQHVSLLEVPVLSVQDEEGVIVEALFRSVSVQMCGDGGIAAHVTCVRERSGEVAVFMVDNT
ncbi:hypothetical protein ACJQWK_02226 [Exserohilum turcicum]|uniref:Uncharacterized protein n=1 Tax=Exserohilum turcicum (strain 28A) TaxID=671987 RepID=R0ISU8_EXST2|nr:uncharacterized protein SETTUDRAFT_28003 [Exserohilum turcica Et28A]EOA87701.1 hypothetical protein SETTUDRAFT_28003 [Exserohilum turcica Et28A]